MTEYIDKKGRHVDVWKVNNINLFALAHSAGIDVDDVKPGNWIVIPRRGKKRAKVFTDEEFVKEYNLVPQASTQGGVITSDQMSHKR